MGCGTHKGNKYTKEREHKLSYRMAYKGPFVFHLQNKSYRAKRSYGMHEIRILSNNFEGFIIHAVTVLLE